MEKDILKNRMNKLDNERRNKKTLHIHFIHVYAAACTSGIATKPVTLAEVDFIIARKLFLYGKYKNDYEKGKEVYKNKINALMETQNGKEFILDHSREAYNAFIPTPMFEIKNVNYKDSD